MTQAEAENIAQLNQLQALKAARDRVLEVYVLMVPVVNRLASEGDAQAMHLINEHNKAQDNLKLVNMDAHAFQEERTETPS